MPVLPLYSFQGALSGTYASDPAFPWRYVNVDTQGESAVFQAGQLIQSLPNKVIRCSSAGGGAVKFYGTPEQHTRLFARGDTSKGVLITNGAIALYGSGAVLIY